MSKKTGLEKRLRKAISALFSVSKWGIGAEYDEERQAYFFRLQKRRRLTRKRKNFDELILVSDGSIVGVSVLGEPEERDSEDKLRGVAQEWEPLFDGYAVGNLTVPNSLPGVANRIDLRRDEFYDVVGQVTGEFPDYNSRLSALFGQAPPSGPEITGPSGSYSQRFVGYTLGEAIKSQDIYGTDYSDSSSEIHLWSCQMQGLPHTEGDPRKKGPYRAWLDIEKAEKSKVVAEVASLQEWFLNGPRGYVYPRYTARTTEGPFKKRRIFPENVSITAEPEQQWVNPDFAFIQLEKLAFVIQAVPERFGPPWSHNVGFEYRKEWGGIPDDHDRENIKEIVSFVIGRPLLTVGHTAYDGQGNAIKQVSTGPGLPHGYSIVSLCKSGDTSPIDFQSGALEESLSALIPPYMLWRDELRLNEALYRYWFAKIHPIGLDLPVFAAAVEGLANSWHKSTKAKVAKQYMSEDDFSETFKEEIAAFEQKLKSVKYGERIMNRIRNAHRMGSNEQIEHFFSDISLSIGKVERTAMKSRNAMAHGSSSDYTDDKYDQVVRIRWAYQTLFERVLLKILGFGGSYVDRSSKGWQERRIDTPMEGTKE